jgi:lipopolysaccharide/colanic/teichoic acid biosynthesis glycosyltransferase
MSDSVRVFLPTQPVSNRPLYHAAKRVFDVGVSLLALVFLAPLMLIISIAILIDSPGPILFWQERVGKHARHFQICKFRTMVANHDTRADREYMAQYVNGNVSPTVLADGSATYKPAHSAHITRVGRFLRTTSLDELPQVWNILRGEMSIIGPRPNVTWEVEQYADWHFQRLQVLPGITGLAQVHGRSTISFDEIVDYDLKYIRHQGFKMDLQILWWTVVRLMERSDAA